MSLSFFTQLKILTFESVGSSNTEALQRLKNGEAQNGDIIVAKYQTAGKGQAQNSWFSSKGNNLLASFICKDIQLKVSQLPKLNMLVSLSVYDTVKIYFPNITTIKWPNDIMVREQKIAGILIETNLAGDYIKNAVIGIGLNVNEEEFPDEMPNACSFNSLTKQYFDLDTILKILLEKLDFNLSKMKSSKFDVIQQEYESVLFGMGAKRYFRTSGKNFEGIIRGINSQGQLRVEKDNRIELFNNKEITFELGKH